MTSSTRCDLSDSGVSGISICPAATASVRCRTRRRKGILSGRRSSSYEYTGINESLSGSQCSCIVPCASAGQACKGCEVYTCYVSLIGVIHSTLVPVERAIARARCILELSLPSAVNTLPYAFDASRNSRNIKYDAGNRV